MQRTDFADMVCPAARALACVGEWWSLLILRDAFQGLRRFDEFKASLGISTNILARRLQHLTESGIFIRRLYQRRPARHEYVLTAKGRELFPLLLLLYRWGNRYEAREGIAVELADRITGVAFDPLVIDRHTGQTVMPEQVMLKPGPAASPAIIARARQMARQIETCNADAAGAKIAADSKPARQKIAAIASASRKSNTSRKTHTRKRVSS
ncbi:MAG TPA: helix-turn-helix domain-containing protein [Dongiaceae bacterium]|nr:helix-turn-helix domain-containing protein [Dongiaceae bacterium]